MIDRVCLSHFHKHPQMEGIMKKDVKKILASLGGAGLISAGGVTLPGHAAGSG
jgi:hypothetical protein